MHKRNVGSQYLISVFIILVSAGINYGIQLVLTPYITDALGTEAYGFVSLAKTFANYATIITVAINSVATRFIAVEYQRNNYKKANIYYSTLFYADLVLGGIILIIAAIIIININNLLNISSHLLFDVRYLFSLSIINVCIISVGTVFNSATLILNRLDLSGLFKILSYSLEAISLLLLFCFFKPRIIYVGYSLAVASLALVIVNYLYSKKATKELVINRSFFSFKAVKEVIATGIWYSINSLGNTLNAGLDLWVSNLLLSAFQMGQLAIVKTVTTIGTALYQLTAQPFQPILLKYYSANNINKLVDTLKLSIKANSCLSNILFAVFIVFGSYYYKLWTPNQDSYFLTYLTMVSLIGAIIEGAVTPLYYVYVLTKNNRIPCLMTLGSGIINVISMYILIHFFNLGLNAVVGTTSVLSWIMHFLFTPIYVSKCLEQQSTLLLSTIIRSTSSALVTVFLFKLVRLIIIPNSWSSLILTVLLCGVIGVLIHFLIVASNYEKQIVLSIVKQSLRSLLRGNL